MIRRVEDRGRCFIANRTFKAGEVLFEEEPYGMVISSPYVDAACGYCGIICSGTTVYALSPDDAVKYCSEKCITVDYPIHSSEMPTALKLRETGIQGKAADPLRLIMRCSAIRKGETPSNSTINVNQDDPLDHPKSGRSNLFSDVLKLEAATSSVNTDARSDVTRIAAALSTIADRSSLKLSKAESEHLLYAIQCNAHQILSHTLGDAPIALGLFPLTSMLNHSCDPNCAHYFVIEKERPPRLVMRAIRDISEGEEMCYSYVNLYQSTAARRAQLFSAYSFTCNCKRCSEAEQQETCLGLDSDRSADSQDRRLGFQFQYDGVIDELKTVEDVSQTDMKKFETTVQFCSSSLLNKGPVQAALAFEKLNTLMKSRAVACFHPANKTLLQAYVSIVDAAMQTDTEFREKTNENTASARINISGRGEGSSFSLSSSSSATVRGDVVLGKVVGYGLLAIGCMKKYVRRRQYEIGSLESLVAKALYQLSLSLPESPPITTAPNDVSEEGDISSRTVPDAAGEAALVSSTDNTVAASNTASASDSSGTSGSNSNSGEGKDQVKNITEELASMSLGSSGGAAIATLTSAAARTKTQMGKNIRSTGVSVVAQAAVSLVTELNLLDDFHLKSHPDINALISASCLNYDYGDSVLVGGGSVSVSVPSPAVLEQMPMKVAANVVSKHLCAMASETRRICRGEHIDIIATDL